jgi:hypothetical protein
VRTAAEGAGSTANTVTMAEAETSRDRVRRMRSLLDRWPSASRVTKAG